MKVESAVAVGVLSMISAERSSVSFTSCRRRWEAGRAGAEVMFGDHVVIGF
jgi:hypothetical protein